MTADDEVGVKATDQFKFKHHLQIGDIVMLNSGGPEGLVVDLDGRGGVTVACCYPDGRIEEDDLPEACWTLVSPGE